MDTWQLLGGKAVRQVWLGRGGGSGIHRDRLEERNGKTKVR
jgi:hypothetical protein